MLFEISTRILTIFILRLALKNNRKKQAMRLSHRVTGYPNFMRIVTGPDLLLLVISYEVNNQDEFDRDSLAGMDGLVLDEPQAPKHFAYLPRIASLR